MSIIENLPVIRPSVLMDIANSRSLPPWLQSMRSSTATCYGPDGRRRTVSANVPRLDYDPLTGKSLGLLVEEGRSNLLPYSDAFTGWTLIGLQLADSTVQSADPAKFAKKIVESATESEHSVSYLVANPAPSTPYVFSVEMKAAERNFGFIRVANVGNQVTPSTVRVDLTTLQTSGVVAGADVWVQRLQDGWVRISLLTTTVANVAGGIRPTFGSQNSLTGSSTFMGDGVSGIYVGAAQFEVGLYPTSYIPTTAATATRAGDAVLFDIPSGIIPRNGFSVFCEVASQYGGDYYPFMLSDSQAALGNYLGPRMTATPYIGSTEGDRTGRIPTRPGFGSPYKLALAAANGTGSGLAINGVSAAGVAVPEADMRTRKFLKFGAVTQVTAGVHRISRLNIYSSVLTAAELRRLTA